MPYLLGVLRPSLRMGNRRILPSFSFARRARPLTNRSLFCCGADRWLTAHRVQRPKRETPLRGDISTSNTTIASVLMIDVGASESQAELMLQDSDFPKGYVDMAHPGDYKATATPLQPQLIEHQGILGHHRLLLRVSFKLDSGRFAPFTFLLDTGAPFHLYLSKKSIQVLQEGGRWKAADPVDYLEILGTKAVVHETPPTHAPANIMGLKMLKLLKLRLDVEDFSFETPFHHF